MLCLKGFLPFSRPFSPVAAFVLLLLWMAAALGVSPASSIAAPPEYEIKLATLAPENSTLAQVFNEMNAELLKETGGQVGFKIFAGFVLGDEEDVLRKLHVGMIQAATFTSAALTDIAPDLRALQVPFLFRDYAEVDYVSKKMDADLRRRLSEKGFEVLGWTEVGFIYFFSTSPIGGLEDFKGKKFWAKANAPMSQALIEKAGVATAAITAPDVLMALQTNLLDVAYSSPYYALVTQWNTQVKYMTDLPLTHVGGALIMDKKTLAKLPPPLREKLQAVSAKYLKKLTDQTRKDNADAMEIIFRRGVQRVTPTPAQAEGLKKLSEDAMATLIPKILPADAMSKVQAALAEYRAQSGGKKP